MGRLRRELSRTVGDLVFKRYGGEVVLSRKPDFEGREWTEAQLAARERSR